VNILLDGIFYNGHGFAEGNRILLRILHKAGYRVRIHARDTRDKNLFLSREEIAFISSFEHTKLDSKDIYIGNFVGSQLRPNPDFRMNIARTTFETDRIPQAWVPELNRFDEVWVQCGFNLQTFRNSGVRVPLRLVPNFFDVNQYNPAGGKLELPIFSPLLFLSVFDLQQRKGYDFLLDAFLQEFSAGDGAALILKVRGDRQTDALERYIESHRKPIHERPPVYIMNQMLSVSDMMALYRTCHAFVLPTRGEGWGRPFFEAMLMEMPVIGTDWSGQLEFMNRENSFLIRVRRLVPIEDSDYPLFNGHCWAEPSTYDLRKKMRYVAEHLEEAKRVGMKARADLLQQYSMEQVAGKVVHEIEKYRELLQQV